MYESVFVYLYSTDTSTTYDVMIVVVVVAIMVALANSLTSAACTALVGSVAVRGRGVVGQPAEMRQRREVARLLAIN